MADDDKLLVVPLGHESKALTQTFSNDTAMQIMGLMADGPMSTSAVAEKLGIPLTTAQYNIEKLMEAGLVKIEKTKYSEKGREVKLYRASKRFIVLVPENTGGQAVIDALKKYLVLVPIAVVMSLLVEYLLPTAQNNSQTLQSASLGAIDKANGPVTYAAASTAPETASGSTVPPVPMQVSAPVHEATRSVADQLSQSITSTLQHPGVLFFAGCLLVLLLLVVLEYFRRDGLPWTRK